MIIGLLIYLIYKLMLIIISIKKLYIIFIFTIIININL